MASAADARLVELLLEAQQEELTGAQPDRPNMLTAVVACCPADYLWEVGSSLVGQGEERTMLGARLIRELSEYREPAAELLAKAWVEAGPPTFEYWMVSAFAFLPADRAIARLVSAAGSTYAVIRDAAASALANVTQTKLRDESEAVLNRLAEDQDPEVRFSAAFEIASLWERHDDLNKQNLFTRLAASDPDPRIRNLARHALSRHE